jgi:hypothetical protein
VLSKRKKWFYIKLLEKNLNNIVKKHADGFDEFGLRAYLAGLYLIPSASKHNELTKNLYENSSTYPKVTA